MKPRVVVVGGGIAGLAVAFELVAAGVDVEVLEAAPRAGGNVHSERRSGYLCEWGPHGFVDGASGTLELCERLGLGPRVVRATDAARLRFVVRDGKLREIASALTMRERLRAFAGKLIVRSPADKDESVSTFAERKLGRAAARVLIDAAVTGTWAGNPDELSVLSAFPELTQRTVARGRLASFPDGLEELPAALAASLGAHVRLGSFVSSLSEIDASAVVLACPAWASAPLLSTVNSELSTLLSGIPSVPVAVVHLGFAADDAAGLRGFGFLVPRGEDASVLGVMLPSNVFPDRAPAGHLLATVMVGGARDPGAENLSDQTLFDKAVSALRKFAGVRAAPSFTLAIRHERAIPQYVVGHAARLAAIDAELRRRPGLFLAGNSFRGISINACLADARSIAARVTAAIG